MENNFDHGQQTHHGNTTELHGRNTIGNRTDETWDLLQPLGIFNDDSIENLIERYIHSPFKDANQVSDNVEGNSNDDPPIDDEILVVWESGSSTVHLSENCSTQRGSTLFKKSTSNLKRKSHSDPMMAFCLETGFKTPCQVQRELMKDPSRNPQVLAHSFPMTIELPDLKMSASFYEATTVVREGRPEKVNVSETCTSQIGPKETKKVPLNLNIEDHQPGRSGNSKSLQYTASSSEERMVEGAVDKAGHSGNSKNLPKTASSSEERMVVSEGAVDKVNATETCIEKQPLRSNVEDHQDRDRKPEEPKNVTLTARTEESTKVSAARKANAEAKFFSNKVLLRICSFLPVSDVQRLGSLTTETWSFYNTHKTSLRRPPVHLIMFMHPMQWGHIMCVIRMHQPPEELCHLVKIVDDDRADPNSENPSYVDSAESYDLRKYLPSDKVRIVDSQIVPAAIKCFKNVYSHTDVSLLTFSGMKINDSFLDEMTKAIAEISNEHFETRGLRFEKCTFHVKSEDTWERFLDCLGPNEFYLCDLTNPISKYDLPMYVDEIFSPAIVQ